LSEPSREELIELVRKIQNQQGTEEECFAWMKIVENHVPDPYVSDLMFFSQPSLSPEEVIERAFEFQATQLPPPSDDSQ
jgi:hypothetical protein